MDLFTLVARLGMDSSEYERGISKARGSFSELSSSISAKTVALGNMISHAMEKAVNMAGDLGRSAIQNAADVTAERAQFQATFGVMQGEAEKAFAGIEKETGIFGTRLQNVGTKAFSQFAGAGIKGADGLAAMEEYTKLAADAAAYYDISLEDADARLRSFLRGNTEAGDAIGLFTSESQRNTAAMEKYGAKWKDLTEAQKQMLMLDISKDIYEQSGAIGQAARESDNWTSVVGNLKEAWKQVSALFGAPIVAVITPILQSVSDWLNDPAVKLKVEQFGLGVADKINEFFSWIVQPTFPTWEEIKEGSKETLNGIKEGIKSVLNWTLGKFGAPDVDTIVRDVREWWTGKGDDAYERVKGVLSWTFGKFVKPGLEDVKKWWNDSGKQGTAALLDWAMGELVLPAANDIVVSTWGTIRAWWAANKPTVSQILTWAFGEWEPPNITKIVSDWWNGVKDDVSDLLTFTITPKINTSAQQLTEGYKTGGIAGAISAAWNSAWYNPANWGSETKIETQESGATGSFATGLDYVPYDNFRARLHEGEAVLTRTEADAWRAGGAVPFIDYDAMGAAVARALSGSQKVFAPDGRVLGDIVTEQVSRNIAAGARSRRYG